MLRRLIRRLTRRRPMPSSGTLHGWARGGRVDPPRPPEPRGWQRQDRAQNPWHADRARIERQRAAGRSWWGRAEPDDGWRRIGP